MLYHLENVGNSKMVIWFAMKDLNSNYLLYTPQPQILLSLVNKSKIQIWNTLVIKQKINSQDTIH